MQTRRELARERNPTDRSATDSNESATLIKHCQWRMGWLARFPCAIISVDQRENKSVLRYRDFFHWHSALSWWCVVKWQRRRRRRHEVMTHLHASLPWPCGFLLLQDKDYLGCFEVRASNIAVNPQNAYRRISLKVNFGN